MGPFDATMLAEHMREVLKTLEINARQGIIDLKNNKADGEVIAQATLALRHIEDARMRYWKVIQYSWDGVSVYDKK